ncbi:MAG: YdgA family protein [Acidiferrobacterales bacterium]
MKKIVTILGMVLILLVVAAGAAPFWFGMQAENAYNSIVEQMAKNGSTTVRTKHYERGWLRSTAETVVTLPGLPVDVSLTHDIAHGPLALDRLMQGQLELTPAVAFVSSRATLAPRKGAETLKDLIKQLPPATADTVLALSGNAEMQINVPPSRRKSKDGGAINWRGLSGTIVFRERGEQVIAELQSPGLSFPSKNGEFSLSQVKFRSDATGGKAGFMFGNSALHVANIGIGPDVTVKGLRFTTNAKPVGPNVNTTVSYQVKDVQVGANHYGPGQLTIVLRKLDAAALRKYETAINTISKRGLPDEQRSMMVAAETMKLIANLSKKAPELEITKLSFKSREGELTGEAKFILDGSNLNVAENTMLLLRALQGEAKLSIPPSMVKAILTPRIRQDIEIYKRRGMLSQKDMTRLTPEVMSSIVDEAYPSYLNKNGFTKLLIPDGPYYRISVSFRQGRFLVNDRPLKQPLLGLGA